MASTIIAKHIGTRSTDEAYTLGLFHNCGIPLLMLRFDNYNTVMRDSYSQPERRVIDSENEQLQTNHAVVGYYVAKSWNLAPYICGAIADHHSVDMIFSDHDYPDSEKKNLLAILKMAETICGSYRILGDEDCDYEWQRIETEVLNYIGLSQYDFNNLKENCMELGLGGGSYLGN